MDEFIFDSESNVTGWEYPQRKAAEDNLETTFKWKVVVESIPDGDQHAGKNPHWKVEQQVVPGFWQAQVSRCLPTVQNEGTTTAWNCESDAENQD